MPWRGEAALFRALPSYLRGSPNSRGDMEEEEEGWWWWQVSGAGNGLRGQTTFSIPFSGCLFSLPN